jgi:hypothetical protein
MKKIGLMLPLFLLLLSCGSSKLTGGEVKGTVTDVTGLDGCGILIKLDNGTTLQPVVLPAGFILKKNKRVKLKYTVLKDRMSTCINGSIAEITTIRYL